MQAVLERAKPGSDLSNAEQERAAATRGIASIDSGKWKQHDTWVHFPPSWIREILERFASGETSLLEDGGAPVATRRRKKRSDIKIGERTCVVNQSVPTGATVKTDDRGKMSRTITGGAPIPSVPRSCPSQIGCDQIVP